MIVEENQHGRSRITELRHFTGPSRELWPPLAETFATLVQADRCLFALGTYPSTAPTQGASRTPEDTTTTTATATATPARQWGRLHDWSRGPIAGPANGLLNGALVELAERAAREGSVLHALAVTGAFALALRLAAVSPTETCVSILLLTGRTEPAAREALERLSLVEDTLRLAHEYRQARESATHHEGLTGTLELLGNVQGRDRFYAAAMALCNSLADRFGAERVSLGWFRGPSIRLTAVSRTERVNRQMELAQGLESVMEEAADQDADLAFPPEGDGWITREHAQFSQRNTSPHLATHLLRARSEITGALTLERAARPWDATERQQIRVALDLLGPRLDDLFRQDRWWGARLGTRLRESSAVFLGPRHTWAKLLGLGILALLLALVFVRLPYRVESNFSLRAEHLAQIGVPFDGYIAQAHVRPGSLVTNGQPLLQLDVRDILLEEAAATAEIQRYQREMEKSRASASLGEMRVAEALVRQNTARLAQIRNRIELATLRSPFDGVVIEGDYHERLGQTLRQGEPLFRIARLDRLFVEAEVPERDVHELKGIETGEIAFLTQPAFTFDIRGQTLEPAAVTREGGNVFLYRCELAQPPEGWFRPGMQGIAKINVGPRRLIWILTHRTLDFLRLHLWW
jgi:biotin carboxyl carrier protein